MNRLIKSTKQTLLDLLMTEYFTVKELTLHLSYKMNFLKLWTFVFVKGYTYVDNKHLTN